MADDSYGDVGGRMSRFVAVGAVGVAGFFGAIARYGLEGFVSQRTGEFFPWGTFVVNITGSFVLGFLFATLVEGQSTMAPWLRTAITVGFVGAYTTFSTLTLETFRLIEDGDLLRAAANSFGSLAAGLAAVYLGVVLGRVV
jgi:CrcB protein